jgi:lipopolysaccharide/colanic/teichoic acid biosynthesis glycosyltransferase
MTRTLRHSARRFSIVEFRTSDDVRGRFLRMTRLNQLPTLIGTLRGDLSFEDPLLDVLQAAD